ncbi:MAG: CPBP family intramembrane metalloprotease [Deferribacteraceae bacterium]|nr:CPBP family intramembrane metalloprotease [Deferribacteraceae bacterium]
MPLVLSPIAEELFFRGVLLELFLRKKVNKMFSNTIISILFASLHVILKGDITGVAVFFPSLILGWHYCRNRKIIPVIAAHSAYNLSIY